MCPCAVQVAAVSFVRSPALQTVAEALKGILL